MPAGLRWSSPSPSRISLARSGSKVWHSLAELVAPQRARRQDRVVRRGGDARVHELADGVAVDPHRQGLAELELAEQAAPDLVGGVQVREQRQMRRAGTRPEQGGEPVARLALAQEGVVLEHEVARLQVDLAGAGLDRHQLAVDDVEHEAVDVGQLLAGLVDPVEVGVALGDEALRRRPGDQPPGHQGRHVGVVEVVEAVLAQEQLDPVARAVLGDRLLELLRVGILLVELLQVVGRPIDEELVGGRQGRDEEAVGLGPRPADGQLVHHLDLGLLAVDEQPDVGAAEGQVLVVLDVVPVEPDVLGGERLPVRPFVALAQAQVKIRPSSTS